MRGIMSGSNVNLVIEDGWTPGQHGSLFAKTRGGLKPGSGPKGREANKNPTYRKRFHGGARVTAFAPELHTE